MDFYEEIWIHVRNIPVDRKKNLFLYNSECWSKQDLVFSMSVYNANPQQLRQSIFMRSFIFHVRNTFGRADNTCEGLTVIRNFVPQSCMLGWLGFTLKNHSTTSSPSPYHPLSAEVSNIERELHSFSEWRTTEIERQEVTDTIKIWLLVSYLSRHHPYISHTVKPHSTTNHLLICPLKPTHLTASYLLFWIRRNSSFPVSTVDWPRCLTPSWFAPKRG